MILSGINMPGMAGLELLREIKQWRLDLAVIMMSPYGDDEWRRRNWRIRRCRVCHQASRFRDPEDAAAPTVYRWRLRSSALSRMTAPQTSLERGQSSASGQGPTKSPIVCLASDSRHWGLKNYDEASCSRKIRRLVLS